ncbi:hypothetical protein J3A83DRAFT_4358328 [Scleroderma citrinum]
MEVDTICPTCHSLFPSLGALVHHLNTDGKSCISNLEDSFKIPTPPAFIQGAEETNVMGQYHEHSSHIYGKELAKFLISQFLKLQWPSFETVNHLFRWIGSLPTGPQWQSTKIDIKDYKTVEDTHLIWCDGLDVVKDLFSNPIFANYMTFNPHKDQLPQGSTIIPVILSSDKMPVTHHTGALEMHPVFMTIGNIQSDIRMQAMSHAWHCIAFIPSLEFKVHSDFQTILQAWVFHWSLDIVTTSLKDSADHGCDLVDPSRHIRNCYTPLIAYIVDLPEQLLISCISKNASPVTIAMLPQFRDPAVAAPQTGQDILSQIKELCEKVDPWDLNAFQKAAKCNWKFSDPSLFLTGKILHTGHKFFFNHVLKWCKAVIGSHTLNTCFSNLHQCISFHHFLLGISHQLQMTGRDHCDIERMVVPILDGAGIVTDEFIHAIHTLVEFIYCAQDPIHTDSLIATMEQVFAEFHTRKHSIITLGVQKGASGTINHFNIPKLELMKSFRHQMKSNGILIQFTADMTECLLIMHCKTLFQHTNHQVHTYVVQVVEILNHEETIRTFNLYLILWQAENLAMVKIICVEHEEVTMMDPTLEFIQQVAPKKEYMFCGPHPFHNHFENPNSFILTPRDVTLHVTVHPDHQLSLVEMQALYNLPNLPHGNSTCGQDIQGNMTTWNKFHLQLHSAFCSHFVERSQVVQAYPLSNEHPLGYCNTVLLCWPVCAVFIPKAKYELPAFLATVPLCYVCFFHVLPLSAVRPSVGLYQVEHVDPSMGFVTGIIPLTEVFWVLELVPVFDTMFPNVAPSSKTCMEGYGHYYLNTVVDKDTFHNLHLQSQ